MAENHVTPSCYTNPGSNVCFMLTGYDDLLSLMEVDFKGPSKIFTGHCRAGREHDLIRRCCIDKSSGSLRGFLENPTGCQFTNAIISAYGKQLDTEIEDRTEKRAHPAARLYS